MSAGSVRSIPLTGSDQAVVANVCSFAGFVIAGTASGVVSTDISNVTKFAPANGTIFDRLHAHGITWRDYASDLPGVAVIANRPFGSGDLFGKVRSKPLPDWAAEFDCRSWAQFFLKWIVANPAITCAIPATDKARHLEDNMQGGIGRLPDAKMRRRMAELIASL